MTEHHFPERWVDKTILVSCLLLLFIFQLTFPILLVEIDTWVYIVSLTKIMIQVKGKTIFKNFKNFHFQAKKYLKDYVADDFKRTGKCNLQVARDGFITLSLTFALPKNSPYTNTINRG